MVDITFVSLVVSLRLEKTCSDPYALFFLKGSFETAFRQAAGCSGPDCISCGKEDFCVCHDTFSRSLTADPSALRRFQKPSLPFVFTVPQLPPPPNKGDIVHLGLTLIGSAVHHLPLYLSALRQVLLHERFQKQCPLSIVSTWCLDYHHQPQLLQEEGSVSSRQLLVLSMEGLQQTSLVTTHEVTILFQTPLRLLREGRPVRELSFSPFIRALFRRVSSLAYYYAGVEMDLDFRWLSETSTAVTTEPSDVRWATWDGPFGKVDGLVGTWTFRGDLTEFLPFILFGEHVHVGKGAPFGLGSYRIHKMRRVVENGVAIGKL